MLVSIMLVLTVVTPGYAFFRGRVWIGPGWWGPRVYPYYWAPYPYYYGPPVIQQPPVYAEPAPQPEERQQNYWYYCTDPQGYYPYVKQCPKGWLKVVPTPVPPDAEK